jgi:hypothetical protein
MSEKLAFVHAMAIELLLVLAWMCSLKPYLYILRSVETCKDDMLNVPQAIGFDQF